MLTNRSSPAIDNAETLTGNDSQANTKNESSDSSDNRNIQSNDNVQTSPETENALLTSEKLIPVLVFNEQKTWIIDFEQGTSYDLPSGAYVSSQMIMLPKSRLLSVGIDSIK